MLISTPWIAAHVSVLCTAWLGNFGPVLVAASLKYRRCNLLDEVHQDQDKLNKVGVIYSSDEGRWCTEWQIWKKIYWKKNISPTLFCTIRLNFVNSFLIFPKVLNRNQKHCIKKKQLVWFPVVRNKLWNI